MAKKNRPLYLKYLILMNYFDFHYMLLIKLEININITHTKLFKILCCKSAFAEYALFSVDFQKLLVCDSNQKLLHPESILAMNYFIEYFPLLEAFSIQTKPKYFSF